MNNHSNTKIEEQLRKGESCWQNENFVAAFDIYRQLLFDLMLNQEAESVFVERFEVIHVIVIDRLVDLAILFGYFDAAENLLKGMIALNAQAQNREGKDYASVKYLEMILGKGDLFEAYNFLKAMAPSIGDIEEMDLSNTGLDIWEQKYFSAMDFSERKIFLSRLYLVIGKLLAALGQYKDAVAALERGRNHSLIDAPDLAQQTNLPLRLSIAAALQELGDLSEAGKLLEAINSEIDLLARPDYRIRWLELLGKSYLLQGQLGFALEQFRLVLELSEKHQFEFAGLIAMLNLAHIQILVNQTNEAHKLLAKVSYVAKQKGEELLFQRASCLIQVADARSHSLAGSVSIAPSVTEILNPGNFSSTIASDNDPIALIELPQSSNYLSFFEDNILQFHWYLGLGNLQEAANQLQHIKSVFEKTDSDLIHLRIYVVEGIFAYYLGQLEQAEHVFSSIIPVIKELGLKPELWQIQKMLGWCWTKLGRLEKEINILSRDTNQLLHEITSSLSGVEQTIFQLNKWTADEEYIATEIDQLIALQYKNYWWNPFARWQLLKRLNALINYVERYKQTITERSLESTTPSITEITTSLWKRLTGHSKKRLTISFLVLPDRVLIIGAKRFSLKFGVSPITRIEIRNLIREWHETTHRITSKVTGNSKKLTNGSDITRSLALGKSGSDGNNRCREIADYLAKQLQIIDLLDSSKGIAGLTFIPDDSLHGFPFSTIPYRSKYLVEHYPISVSYKFESKRQRKFSGKSKNALIVGISKGTSTLPSLPGTKKEVDMVERWLKKRQFRIEKYDDAANEMMSMDEVIDSLSRTNFFHIASHGTFESNQPDQSGFVFVNSSGKTEILSLRDLSKLNLQGLQYATLSSCWSADNFILPGRFIISLPETFWRAGAHSILGSLWPISDDFAVAFFSQLYQYLEQYSIGKALQKTQIDCIHNNLSGYKYSANISPELWASFNLYGEPDQELILGINNL